MHIEVNISCNIYTHNYLRVYYRLLYENWSLILRAKAYTKKNVAVTVNKIIYFTKYSSMHNFKLPCTKSFTQSRIMWLRFNFDLISEVCELGFWMVESNRIETLKIYSNRIESCLLWNSNSNRIQINFRIFIINWFEFNKTFNFVFYIWSFCYINLKTFVW